MISLLLDVGKMSTAVEPVISESTNAAATARNDAQGSSSRLAALPPSDMIRPKSMPEISTAEHEEAIENVAEHFARDGYALEGTALSEDEMMWLVRARCRILAISVLIVA